jgi:transcription antitermination protein NusB
MLCDEVIMGSTDCEQEQPVYSSNLSKRDTRALTFHLLYAMDAFGYDASLEAIADNFGRGFLCIISYEDDAFTQAKAIVEEREELDAQVKPLLDNWRFERLGVCTRLIIRLALWQIINTDTISSVIINEAVELAKCFAERDAYKFVNGVLDEWIQRNQVSPLEVKT